jgi:hypothetical protein
MRGKTSLYSWVGLALLLLVTGSWAQVTVDLKLKTDKATVGDQIPLTLSATVPRGSKVQFPVLPEAFSSLVVLNSQEKEVTPKGDQDYHELNATIAAYDTGNFQIPALPVKVFPPNDTSGTEYLTSAGNLFIASVLPDSGNPQIVDIRSQMNIPITLWEIIWKVAIILGIIGLGYGIYRGYIWWKRRKGKLPIPLPPPIPPHELAYRELMELQEQKLWQDGKLPLYYFKLSEIIRRYIEGRYGFPALEMATWDIKQVLPDYISKDELLQKIEIWMESADMVKFAKDLPSWEACEQALEFAYHIVDETKEIPVVITQEKPAEEAEV